MQLIIIIKKIAGPYCEVGLSRVYRAGQNAIMKSGGGQSGIWETREGRKGNTDQGKAREVKSEQDRVG